MTMTISAHGWYLKRARNTLRPTRFAMDRSSEWLVTGAASTRDTFKILLFDRASRKAAFFLDIRALSHSNINESIE